MILKMKPEADPGQLFWVGFLLFDAGNMVIFTPLAALPGRSYCTKQDSF